MINLFKELDCNYVIKQIIQIKNKDIQFLKISYKHIMN